MKNPTPEQIKQARIKAGLTQKVAGSLIYKTQKSWQNYELGYRSMDYALFELFEIKVKQWAK